MSISADRIVSRAERLLRLTHEFGWTNLDGYSSLSDALLQCEIETSALTASVTVTTVLSQSAYSLPADLGRIDRIRFPWTGGVKCVSPQHIEKLIEGYGATATGDPTTYAVMTPAGGVPTLSLFPYQSIIAAESIIIHYYPIEWARIVAGTSIDLPDIAVPMILAATCKNLSLQWRPELTLHWQQEFERAKGIYDRRRSMANNEIQTIESRDEFPEMAD